MSRQNKESRNVKTGKIGMSDSEEQKEKILKKSEQSLQDLWNTVKWVNTYSMGVLRRERKKKKQRDI